MTESQWGEQFTGLAERLGWSWFHARTSQSGGRWTTALSGPIGKGCPDYFLAHEKGRHMFVELKTETGKLRPDQVRVIGILNRAGVETHVFRPSDFEEIERVLSCSVT
jgi:hypothetical protein